VVVAAVAISLLLRTRFLPVAILVGMLLLIGGGGVLLVHVAYPAPPALALSAVLLGLGAGSTVAPGLFLAGFSLPSKILGRVFALIELVRSVADFILAPIILKFARTASGGEALSSGGVTLAIWIALAFALVMTAAGIALYLAGSARLPKPDLDLWLERGGTAVKSPALLEVVR
jgi:hypothetical protein